LVYQAVGFMMHLPQSETMRRNMVDSQLRPSGVNTPWIISAMLDTPREAFIPGDNSGAYMDRAVPLGGGRWLNPPVAHGHMLMLADIAPTDRVLLVGGGTGYLAALVSRQVRALVVVEESAALAEAFSANLPDVSLVQGPLSAGAAGQGEFDLILVDGAIAALPDALAAQLAEDGRIVAGLVDGPVMRLATGMKRAGHVTLRPVLDMEIAPLPGFELAKEFVF
jgi:protein-L-isoaspartate(D-aspartate) O-methyltransferase